MREQLEALIAELLADAASEPDRGCDDWDAGYQDGRRDARRNLADRLATALAADAGGWRPDDAAIKRAVYKWFHHSIGHSFEESMRDAILAAFNSPPPQEPPR